YRPADSDMDFRPDFPATELSRLRARARNAMLLLDLENCDKGYSPTRWQRDRLPAVFHDKVRVIFDGVDTPLWRPLPPPPPRPARAGWAAWPSRAAAAWSPTPAGAWSRCAASTSS